MGLSIRVMSGALVRRHGEGKSWRAESFYQRYPRHQARKRTEDALRASEETLMADIRTSRIGISHVGLDGGWFTVDSKVCELRILPR